MDALGGVSLLHSVSLLAVLSMRRTRRRRARRCLRWVAFNVVQFPCHIRLSLHAQSAPTAGKALLGVGALVGGALLIFQEIDTALEVAGIFAAGQFALRRLLFAEDRRKTQEEIKCGMRTHICAVFPPPLQG